MVKYKVLRLMYRDFKTSIFFRPRNWLVQLSFPLSYLYISGLIYGNIIRNITVGGKSIPYMLYLAAGLMVVQIYQGAGLASWMIWVDRDTGALQQIIIGAYTVSDYIVSKVLSTMTKSIINALAFLALSLPLLYAYLRVDTWSFALLVYSLCISSAFFTFLNVALISSAKEYETYRLISGVILFPLMFLSSAFYPVDRAPPALQMIMLANPLTHTADLTRLALLKISSRHTPIFTVLLPVETIIIALISVKTFMKIYRKEWMR